MTTPKQRLFEADLLRGVAIILMVIFHLCFDLNYFRYIDIDIYSGSGWKAFRIVIVSLFLGLMGASLVFAYRNGINRQKFLKRLALLSGAAALITAATTFVFPKSWIYFGVIHFAALATLVGVWFVRMPTISLVLGITVIGLYHLDILSTHWLYELLKDPLSLPHRTEDIVRFFPWFGAVLIGIFVGHHRFFGLKLPEINLTRQIAFLGRHSLLIYLIHQPIMFGTLMGVYRLTSG